MAVGAAEVAAAAVAVVRVIRHTVLRPSPAAFHRQRTESASDQIARDSPVRESVQLIKDVPFDFVYLKERNAVYAVYNQSSDGDGETVPSTVDGIAYPVHPLQITAMGMLAADSLNLEDLADACARAPRERLRCRSSTRCNLACAGQMQEIPDTV